MAGLGSGCCTLQSFTTSTTPTTVRGRSEERGKKELPRLVNCLPIGFWFGQ